MTADVLFPTSAAEAASFYGDGADITVVGGGTILLPEIAAGRVTPTRALMLNRTGLDTLRVDGDRVVIGAMVPIAALVDAPDAALARVAPHLADREVRQSATVGGNLSAAGAADATASSTGSTSLKTSSALRLASTAPQRTAVGPTPLTAMRRSLPSGRAHATTAAIEYE
jgi:CO/xanthine dehydrogenase FAD-binding subunit